MLAKYHIEYAVPFRRYAQTNHHLSDDPVAAEEFLVELLERGYKILAVRHEGEALQGKKFDRFIKQAASELAARRICASLGIKPEEERHRFGFSA